MAAIVGAVSAAGLLDELDGKSGKVGVREINKMESFYLTNLAIKTSKPRKPKDGEPEREPVEYGIATVIDTDNNELGDCRFVGSQVDDIERLVSGAADLQGIPVEQAAGLIYGPLKIVRYRGEYRLSGA